jgi:hypothetical protein
MIDGKRNCGRSRIISEGVPSESKFTAIPVRDKEIHKWRKRKAWAKKVDMLRREEDE